MKHLSCKCALLLLLVACAAKTPDAPTIQLTDVGFTLHLPAAMQHALDSIAPGFHSVPTTSFRSDVSQAAASDGGGLPALSAAIGDFNHDGTIDAVVEGTVPGDSTLRVIAILNGAKPTAIDVARYAAYDADAVGIYLTNPTGGRTGAFEIVSYPDSSSLYQYGDGAFTGTKVGS
jgi:hypothetical protein